MQQGPLEVCILAAGVGSRMRSNKAKVLQTLAGRPLLRHLLDAVNTLSPSKIHVIIGEGGDEVRQRFDGEPDVNWVEQAERRGTGHAVMQAAPHIADDSRVLVLLGDAPLVKPSTIKQLVSTPADLVVLSVIMDDPSGYGRIVRDGAQVTQIVEHLDATDEQRAIQEINTGVMAISAGGLKQWLGMLKDDNAQSEYLLTDIVEHANTTGASVQTHIADNPIEVTGVNTFVQLSALERAMQKEQATELMNQGVHIIDPDRFDLRGQLNAGKGVTIDINVIIEGEVTLGDNVKIGPNVVIKDAVIASGSEIKANSVVEEAQVGNNCSVGPFARLRPGAELSDDVHIGNFVEVKKSKIGKGSKANHLAYLGDTTIGEEVNVGAGTITCNYDGVNKHETHIGDGAFIGSNSSLVAPVSIGAGSTVGAGSTITSDVDSQVLAVGRSKQRSIANWQRPTKKS